MIPYDIIPLVTGAYDDYDTDAAGLTVIESLLSHL